MKLRIKDFTTKVGSGVTPRGGAEVYKSEGIPLFRSQNVTNEGLLLEDIAYIDEEVHQSMSGTHLKAGDVLLNITGASIGRCYYLPMNFKEGNVNQHVCIIRPKNNVIPQFLYYNLISDDGQRKIDLSQTGANREGLTKEDICNFRFVIPSLEEQNRIVSYLDTKTTAIDKQVSLLSEKRNAYLRLKKSIINRAVTKGLNPDVKMKDSGVEWIGEIPEHWKIAEIKSYCKEIFAGATPSTKQQEYWDGDIPWIPSGSCHDSLIISYDKTITKLGYDNSSTKLIKPNTALLAMTGATCANTGYLTFSSCANQSVCAYVENEKICNSKFLFYLLQSARGYILTFQTGGAQAGINVQECSSFKIPFIPLPEQQSISNYLDDKCSKIDSIVSNIDTQIEKYKLLKRALINEVVTGKRAV